MKNIDIHADDYGLSPNNCRHIIECLKQGKLDSISILPNHTHFNEFMELLLQEWDSFPKKPLLSIHLNLIDGYSLAEENLSLLHKENKLFTASWGSLFLSGLCPGQKRNLLKQQLELEIKAQIDTVFPLLPSECGLRIDSHMHTHMIPIVSQSLLSVIDTYHYPVEFIRIAQEPIVPFLQKISLYRTYSPINFVKNIILNLFSPFFKKELAKRGISYGLLWGLIMSGHMDKDRIHCLLPSMISYANRKQLPLEILFHPGQTLKEEVSTSANKPDVTDFYISDHRTLEEEAVLSMTL